MNTSTTVRVSAYVFVVNGMDRICPAALWECLEGPKPPISFECDGCTMSPEETIGGFAVWPACRVHDWHYSSFAPNDVSRMKADAIFRKNIWRVLRNQGCPWYRAAYTAGVYWFAVRRFGAAHFRRPK